MLKFEGIAFQGKVDKNVQEKKSNLIGLRKQKVHTKEKSYDIRAD